MENPTETNTEYDYYTDYDISHELYREVHFANGTVYRIDNPVTLIIRRDGHTHRVVDAQGVVHCYVAPESGRCVLKWKSRNPAVPVAF